MNYLYLKMGPRAVKFNLIIDILIGQVDGIGDPIPEYRRYEIEFDKSLSRTENKEAFVFEFADRMIIVTKLMVGLEFIFSLFIDEDKAVLRVKLSNGVEYNNISSGTDKSFLSLPIIDFRFLVINGVARKIGQLPLLVNLTSLLGVSKKGFNFWSIKLDNETETLGSEDYAFTIL